MGISQRIDSEQERDRLLQLMEKCLEQDGSRGQDGFILRTVAEGASEAELLSDIRFLRRLWQSVEQKLLQARETGVLYRDQRLYVRAMRDLLKPEVEKIRIDNPRTYEEITGFSRAFIPEIVDRIQLYEGERPLFELYGVDGEIEKALHRTVKLKSGGNLVIDQNEAMATIDVNTGAFLGSRNQEETIFKTNLEAARASARQLKVRNLGGIIILDFIDMENEEHQRQVLRTLIKALEKDPARTRVTGMSELGLVEMTRKRKRESLEQTLCHECPSCKGRDTIKTPET
ncbi:MAG: Rne/Rng family ribonuclease, partial [Pseudohongiellaceae bacterium]